MRASRTPQLRRKWTSPQWTHRFEAESRFFLVLTTLLRLLLRVYRENVRWLWDCGIGMVQRQRTTSCLRCSFFARRIFHRSSSFLVGFPGPARLESTLGFTLAYLAIMLPSRCFRTLNGRI